MKLKAFPLTICFVIFAWALTLDARDVSKATLPASREAPAAPNWWGNRHRAKLAEIARCKDVDVVFLGDSILHYWEERHPVSWSKWTKDRSLNALNLGFSGDQTEHVMWRITNGELDGYRAKAIVLLIGTNNAGHIKESEEPASNVAAGIRAILDVIKAKQPQAKVILCAILPRGKEKDFADNVPWRNLEANVLIRRFCDGKNVIWCDFGNEYLGPRGIVDRTLMPDQLHPSAAGYEIFAKAVFPVVWRLIGAKESAAQ